MNEINDGGPAFPTAARTEQWLRDGAPGMSVRAYFAISFAAEHMGHEGSRYLNDERESEVMEIAVSNADALIRALATPPQKVSVPFNVLALNDDELGALTRLNQSPFFDDLPADIQSQAIAAAEQRKNNEQEIPF